MVSHKEKKTGTVSIPKQILESKDEEVYEPSYADCLVKMAVFSFQINRGPRVEIQVKSKNLRDGFVDLAERIGFKFRIYAYLPPNGKMNRNYRLLERLDHNKSFVGWKKSALSKMRII
jgi:hypothetical protein